MEANACWPLRCKLPFLLESPVIHDDVFHGHLVGSLTGDLTSTGLWRPAAPTNLALTSITIQRKHVVVMRWRLGGGGGGRNHKMIGVFRVRQQIRSRGIWRWWFGRGNRSIVHQMLMVIEGRCGQYFKFRALEQGAKFSVFCLEEPLWNPIRNFEVLFEDIKLQKKYVQNSPGVGSRKLL